MLAHACYLTDPRIRREAESLAETGYEVHVISLSEESNGIPEPREASIKGVHLHRLPVCKQRGNFLRYIYEYWATGVMGGLRLARLHFRCRLDVVHIHNMPDILVLAAIIPWLGGSKLILDIHDPMPELYMSQGHTPGSVVVRLLRFQERISCWLADSVISVNETMRENLRAKGVSDEKIFIVHNFPHQEYFQPCQPSGIWPRSPERLVLLYCGTVTEHYDLGLAVKAIARLAGEIPIQLRIMGSGNRLSAVLDSACKLGIRSAIEVIGTVPIEKVAEEMRKADMGISCHRAGIFGDLYFSTKIVEYLTQGLPVLSPRTYTVNRYLPDDCMFYYEPGNEAALADAIRFVWRNPAEVLKRLAQAKPHLIRLSWQAEKARYINFYRQLLGDATAPRETAPAGGDTGSVANTEQGEYFAVSQPEDTRVLS
jgi:glycosyltransferase involved in cell wall biosynthesis